MGNTEVNSIKSPLSLKIEPNKKTEIIITKSLKEDINKNIKSIQCMFQKNMRVNKMNKNNNIKEEEEEVEEEANNIIINNIKIEEIINIKIKISSNLNKIKIKKPSNSKIYQIN